MAKPAKTSRTGASRAKRRAVPQDTRVIDMLGLPEEISFADALADAFTPPEFLTLHRPDDSLPGPVIDAINIRGYFLKAITRLALDEPSIKRMHSK